MQRKLCMGVGLRVPPARCSQITDSGRNLSELFLWLSYFSPPSLCCCSDSALLIPGRWEWLQQLQEQVFLCIVWAVLQLGTRMSPAPKGPLPLRLGTVNDLEGGDNGQVVT